MSFFGTTDFMLEVAKGNIPGHSGVNKFGRNTDVDISSSPEDIWDGGGIWVPPTQARIHDIASSSANDTSAGTGFRTIRVYGLTDWDTAETSEDITMNGTTNVPTVNSYVIIHRMHGLTAGSNQINVGDITATAQTDGTVTAQISADTGQTLMAIYGVPSTKSLFVNDYYTNWSRTSGAANKVDVGVFILQNPDDSDAAYRLGHFSSLFGSGSTFINYDFKPHAKLEGPFILKIQAVLTDANNTEVSAGFNGVLVDN